MARGVNKVIIVGNLGSDPEVRYMPSGDSVTEVSIATSDGWKDKQSGEAKERTEWHRVVFYKRLAEITGEYLRKGSKVYIEGSLRTDKWTDKDGNDRYTTKIIASSMQMLDSRGDSQAAAAAMSSPPASAHAPSQPAPAAKAEPAFDDDIPF